MITIKGNTFPQFIFTGGSKWEGGRLDLNLDVQLNLEKNVSRNIITCKDMLNIGFGFWNDKQKMEETLRCHP